MTNQPQVNEDLANGYERFIRSIVDDTDPTVVYVVMWRPDESEPWEVGSVYGGRRSAIESLIDGYTLEIEEEEGTVVTYTLTGNEDEAVVAAFVCDGLYGGKAQLAKVIRTALQ